MKDKVNFTKALLSGLEAPPKGQRFVLRDTKATGLQCRMTSAGVKTFSVFRRVKGGQPERVTLGKFPDMSIEQARTAASTINAAIASGGSPAQVKRAHKEEMTFGELFAEYLQRHAKPKKRSWKRDEQNYHLYLERPLARKKLSEIERQALGRIHSGILNQPRLSETKAKKPKLKSGATANRVLALASSVFGWGMDAGLCTSNPVKGIKREKEKSRDRFLQADEARGFFESVAMEPNDAIRDYALLSVLTGARRADVISMRWDQVSLTQREWRIPRTKNEESLTVPLTDEAIQILEARKDNGSKFVFPGEGKTGHLAEPRRGWERILKRAGIKNLRLHDLRRTLASWQIKTGTTLAIVGKTLNHKSPQATAVYARLDLDPVRKSVETATSALLEAAGVKKAAEVKPFKKIGGRD